MLDTSTPELAGLTPNPGGLTRFSQLPKVSNYLIADAKIEDHDHHSSFCDSFFLLKKIHVQDPESALFVKLITVRPDL